MIATGTRISGALRTLNKEIDTKALSGVNTLSGDDSVYVMKHSNATYNHKHTTNILPRRFVTTEAQFCHTRKHKSYTYELLSRTYAIFCVVVDALP